MNWRFGFDQEYYTNDNTGLLFYFKMLKNEYCT